MFGGGREIENEERGMTEIKSTYHNSSAARIGQRGVFIWCHFVVSSTFFQTLFSQQNRLALLKVTFTFYTIKMFSLFHISFLLISGVPKYLLDLANNRVGN